MSDTEIGESLEVGSDGIIKKLTCEINARQALSIEHDLISLCRVWSRWLERRTAMKDDIIISWSTLMRKKLFPEIIDNIAFGKETVTAHIHVVASIIDSLGDAADVRGGFDYRDLEAIGGSFE